MFAAAALQADIFQTEFQMGVLQRNLLQMSTVPPKPANDSHYCNACNNQGVDEPSTKPIAAVVIEAQQETAITNQVL